MVMVNGTHNMDGALIKNLDELKKANGFDWDFKIIISGDGLTRSGKTTLAGQIGKYLNNDSTEDNWVYSGEELIPTSQKLGEKKVLIYDEARESLDSKKAMQKYSQNIVDYFNECGYLNQFLIIVLPDFFDLNKSVALNLSVFLINVTTQDGFKRGYYEFYSRKNKRLLYIKGKRYNDYTCHSASFRGVFNKFFPYDHEVLQRKKVAAIKKREEKGDKDCYSLKRLKIGIGSLSYILKKEGYMKYKDIAMHLNIPKTTLNDWINKVRNPVTESIIK